MTSRPTPITQDRAAIDRAVEVFGRPTDLSSGLAFWHLAKLIQRGDKVPEWAHRRKRRP